MSDTAWIHDAERAIKHRLLQYCRGIDRCDEELVAGVYHPDATDDHGAFKGLGTEFAAYAIHTLRKYMDATQHSISEPYIQFVDRTTAHVETYVLAVHRRHDDAGVYLERFGGRYVDRFERRNGDWRIADRICIHEWDAKERVELAWAPGRFTEGNRDRTDPAYPPPDVVTF